MEEETKEPTAEPTTERLVRFNYYGSRVHAYQPVDKRQHLQAAKEADVVERRASKKVRLPKYSAGSVYRKKRKKKEIPNEVCQTGDIPNV